MFNVMVSFGEKQWQFMFKEKQNAMMVVQEYKDFCSGAGSVGGFTANAKPTLKVSDDFGNDAMFDAAAVNGVLVEDYSKSVDAALERFIVQAKAQAKAQNKAAQDPLLRMAANGGFPGGLPGFRPNA